jgi:hypothetical protein
MNANEITFGIEIETTLPADSTPVGGHGFGVQIPWLPEGWLADRDPSIHYTAGRMPCEIVSPILKGDEGIQQLVEVVRLIKAHGGRVNQSCGLHVHVGWNGDDKALARLITLVANFEKAIFASTGTKKRESGRWCHGLQRHGDASRARQEASYERYHILNLNNLVTGRRPTVEFRAFAGTLNITKIVGAVRLCVGLVERALIAKRITTFVAKKPVETSPIHRSGEGQTELTRLYMQLGWTKGRQPHIFGNITATGAPSLQTIKKQLMGLARKYDAQR